VRSSYELNFLPRLRDLTGMPDADQNTMFDVMDYLYWAHLSNLSLKFDLTDDDLNWIYASTNSYVWRDHLADFELKTLPSYEWL